MVLCQIYTTNSSCMIDLNLPAGRYRVKLVGAQVSYTAANAIFTLSIQSSFTAQKYGNVRYLQIGNPASNYANINGDLVWEADYNGIFQLDIIDLAINPKMPATGNHWTEANFYFNVEPIQPSNNIHVQ